MKIIWHHGTYAASIESARAKIEAMRPPPPAAEPAPAPKVYKPRKPPRHNAYGQLRPKAIAKPKPVRALDPAAILEALAEWRSVR